MKQISLAMIGFGNVGRAFARLIISKQNDLENKFGLALHVTGIATLHHGTAIRSDGIDLERALALFDRGDRLEPLGDTHAPLSNLDFIQACPADALLENSPVNHDTGQPAIDHLKAALQKGMHAITANKGPVVHGFQELNDLAAHAGRRFLFESTVMDGAPIFSLFRGPLPAVQINGFFGILNSCTNYILGRMEKGETFEQAVASAQSIGITETDPSDDIDGWDAAIKVAALSTVLMHTPLTPQQVERHSMRWISPEMIAEAAKENTRWKLVCRAKRRGERVEARVSPEKIAAGSPLYSISGTSSYVQFDTDVLPGLGIVESNPSPTTTAYGLLADLVNAVRDA
jgi:homoserine dehydrogenase